MHMLLKRQSPWGLLGHVLLLALLVLTACGRQDDAQSAPSLQDSSSTASGSAALGEGVTALQVAVVTDDFAVGTPRVPFVLYDGPDRVSDAQEVKVTLFDLAQDPPTAGWSGWATNYSDYAVPYWVMTPEVLQTGNWGVLAQIMQADGTETEAQFVIEVLAEPRYPFLGDTPPQSINRTLATEPDIQKLTSDFKPEPALYQLTIQEAVANGQPTVVAFSTPGFCQTAVCAPVLESIKEVYNAFSTKANFIHVEVYKQFNPELVLADEMVEWELMTEPWTYILNSSGVIEARFGGPVSARELTAALEPLIGSDGK